MTAGTHRYSRDELEARMDRCGVNPRLKEAVHTSAEFHSYPAPGALIGAFMVDYALELLGVLMRSSMRSARPRSAPPMQPRQ